MARFLKTNLDAEGKYLRIDAGLRGADGKCYLVLHRLPPLYAKAPTFLVELTGERMEIRGEQAASVFFKAYAHQHFTPKELKFLVDTKEGAPVAPFFNFSYPNVLKQMGKTFYKMTDAEVGQITDARLWKLMSGR